MMTVHEIHSYAADLCATLTEACSNPACGEVLFVYEQWATCAFSVMLVAKICEFADIRSETLYKSLSHMHELAQTKTLDCTVHPEERLIAKAQGGFLTNFLAYIRKDMTHG